MKVTELKTRNQYVIQDRNKVAFQSYDSLIAEYNGDEYLLKVYPKYDYSRTTMKYFRYFLEEYVSYADADEIILVIKDMEKNNIKCSGFYDYIISLEEEEK